MSKSYSYGTTYNPNPNPTQPLPNPTVVIFASSSILLSQDSHRTQQMDIPILS